VITAGYDGPFLECHPDVRLPSPSA
jgi:hypothetical protein